MKSALCVYAWHGSFVRKKKMATEISCNATKERITPIQPDRTSAAPPTAAAIIIPEVVKIAIIAIMVPRDSGACSIVKLTLGELLRL